MQTSLEYLLDFNNSNKLFCNKFIFACIYIYIYIYIYVFTSLEYLLDFNNSNKLFCNKFIFACKAPEAQEGPLPNNCKQLPTGRIST